MNIYVEHPSWRKGRNKRKESDNIVSKFKSLSALEKYIINNNDKYPEYDTTYKIYECLDGPRGELIAKIHYKKQIFKIECLNNKWRRFCHNL